ncbi:MAG: rhomboid family intramembrane serine protease, partial [Lactobacillus sp.]|nr:rhomboid family intramembrane serine protease [Lactobacillus sp.]
MNKIKEAIFGPVKITNLLLASLVIVFAVEVFSGGSQNTNTLLKLGAMYNPLLVVKGQWWRLLTSQFLHIGILHLATNAVMIYYMGNYLERILGSSRFLVVYLIGGIGGNLASLAFGGDSAVSAGASTALFGLFGAMGALGLLNQDQPALKQLGQQSIALAVVNLLIDIFMPGIDIWGHAGGLVTGFLFTIILGSGNWRSASKWWRLLSGLGLCLVWIFCLRQG